MKETRTQSARQDATGMWSQGLISQDSGGRQQNWRDLSCMALRSLQNRLGVGTPDGDTKALQQMREDHARGLLGSTSGAVCKLGYGLQACGAPAASDLSHQRDECNTLGSTDLGCI